MQCRKCGKPVMMVDFEGSRHLVDIPGTAVSIGIGQDTSICVNYRQHPKDCQEHGLEHRPFAAALKGAVPSSKIDKEPRT